MQTIKNETGDSACDEYNQKIEFDFSRAFQDDFGEF